MAKDSTIQPLRLERKPVVWLHGEVKTPPFTAEGRKEAGDLLRTLQEGVALGMPHAERVAAIGPRCGALRVRDAGHNWRLVYRVDPDAIVLVEVYAKKTRKIPAEIIQQCRRRLNQYDETTKQALDKASTASPKRRGAK